MKSEIAPYSNKVVIIIMPHVMHILPRVRVYECDKPAYVSIGIVIVPCMAQMKVNISTVILSLLSSLLPVDSSHVSDMAEIPGELNFELESDCSESSFANLQIAN